MFPLTTVWLLPFFCGHTSQQRSSPFPSSSTLLTLSFSHQRSSELVQSGRQHARFWRYSWKWSIPFFQVASTLEVDIWEKHGITEYNVWWMLCSRRAHGAVGTHRNVVPIPTYKGRQAFLAVPTELTPEGELEESQRKTKPNKTQHLLDSCPPGSP